MQTVTHWRFVTKNQFLVTSKVIKCFYGVFIFFKALQLPHSNGSFHIVTLFNLPTLVVLYTGSNSN